MFMYCMFYVLSASKNDLPKVTFLVNDHEPRP